MCDSFVERAKDTLKVSGVQVSPSELETALMAQPDELINDVAVAGVSGGRTSDEKVPRAWIVLSQAGKRKGAVATIKALEEWSRQNLTKQKWLRGGFEIVVEVTVHALCELDVEVNNFGSPDTKVSHREGAEEGATGCVRTEEEGEECYGQVEIVVYRGLCALPRVYEVLKTCMTE